MTINLRRNIMFRGLQRWDGCDRFTQEVYFFDRKHNIPDIPFLSAINI